MAYSLSYLKKNILYCDDSIIAFNKPHNFLSVPGRGFGGLNCLSANLKKIFSEIYVVHRLDMATSGVIFYARNKESQIDLCKQFEKREILKEYVAVVHGRLVGSGFITLPIISDKKNKLVQKICHMNGKKSLTKYTSLEFDIYNNTTRVLLEPFTGRTHQLRVHMKSVGHTIVGDNLYSMMADKSHRMLLHSQRAKIKHPEKNMSLEVKSTPEF